MYRSGSWTYRLFHSRLESHWLHFSDDAFDLFVCDADKIGGSFSAPVSESQGFEAILSCTTVKGVID